MTGVSLCFNLLNRSRHKGWFGQLDKSFNACEIVFAVPTKKLLAHSIVNHGGLHGDTRC